MKRLILALLALITLLPIAGWGADVAITSGDPRTIAIRRFTATGAGNIASTVSIPDNGTSIWEVISIELHLSAVGAANNLTATVDSGSGSAYDVNVITQDMTATTDLLYTFEDGELMLRNTDDLVFSWTNAGAVTYGLTVKYKVK